MHGTEEFVKRLKQRQRDTGAYDYSRVAFCGNKDKVEIVCGTHGAFFQEVKSHINLGTKCPRCSFDSTKTLTDRKNKFVQKAVEAHGEKYNYSLVDYAGAHVKVSILCPTHGVFRQKPSNHVNRKSGCPECNTDRMCVSLQDFIDRCRSRHGDFYDYSLVELKGLMQKILIICPTHGGFYQRAEGHAYGRGCPKCVKRVSKPEYEWLECLGIRERQTKITLDNGKTIHVDGFDKETNTVYQFHGDYWHGNPLVFNKDFLNKTLKKTMGSLLENTIKRDKYVMESGYTIVVKWETDYPDYWEELQR